VRPRTFLAFRELAHRTIQDVMDGETVQLSGTCSRVRGVPFTAHTTGKVIGRQNGVVVVETGLIEVVYQTARQPPNSSETDPDSSPANR
jgi:hypothetical protein